FLLSLLFYTLALLTKETAVAFVPIVICYELLTGRKDEHRSSNRWLTSLFVSVLPYVIVTAVYVLVRTKVLGNFSHELNPLPVTTIALTIPGVIWFYVNHLIFPLPLSAF